VFDVIGTEDAQPLTIAYSALPLCFHMDEAAYESPPGLQLLHCVRSAWSMWHTLSPLLIMLHGSSRVV